MIFQVLTIEVELLLSADDASLLKNLCLDVSDGISRKYIYWYRFASSCLDKDDHTLANFQQQS